MTTSLARRLALLAPVVLLLATGTACGADDSSTSAPSTDASGTSGTSGADFYTDADQLGAAIAGIATAVGTDDPAVTEVDVYPTYVIVDAVDPDAADELNEFTWRDGAAGDPAPIDYGGDKRALEQNEFASSEMPAATIVDFAAAALAKSKIDDAHLDSLTVKVDTVGGGGLLMLASVSSDRDSVTVYGDGTGKITMVS